MVAAPIMAAKQGMKDISFHPVTDQAQPVLQYVNGALTGKGSGLLTPATQTFAGVTQSGLSQSAQAGGAAMHIGSSSLTPAGGKAPTAATPGANLSGAAFSALEGASSMGASSMGSGGMGGQSMAAAQAMMSSAPGAHGSAAAMAGSAIGNPALSQAATSGSAASAASAGGAGLSSLPGITPGMRPAAPQFTPLPTIPAMPRLSDVLGRLGAAIGVPGMSAMAGGNDALSGSGGSGATSLPASQFGGTAPADATEAEYD